jgi:hypothetical protein
MQQQEEERLRKEKNISRIETRTKTCTCQKQPTILRRALRPNNMPAGFTTTRGASLEGMRDRHNGRGLMVEEEH